EQNACSVTLGTSCQGSGQASGFKHHCGNPSRFRRAAIRAASPCTNTRCSRGAPAPGRPDGAAGPAPRLPPWGSGLTVSTATPASRLAPTAPRPHGARGGGQPLTPDTPRVGHPGVLPLPAAALGHLEALLNPRPVGVPARVGGARRQVRQQQPRLVVAGL